MQKITPFLWFDDQAEEAANFYVSVFKNSWIMSVSRYADGGPGPAGTAMSVSFTLDGLEFQALNGGPVYQFTEAISLFVTCEDQAEVDHFWDALIADGGAPSRCGWLKDKYGLSWQIIPRTLMKLMGDPKVVQAMLSMGKIDIAALQAARDGV